MKSIIFILSVVIFGQVETLLESSRKAANLSMQEFIIFLLFVLAAVVLWQNREAKKAAARLATDAALQHRELMNRSDEERAAMNVERATRTDLLMKTLANNSTAFSDNARATTENTRAIADLAILIRDRIPAGK